MKVLIIYCHPNEESFTASVKNLITTVLDKADIAYRITDLYQESFDPVIHKDDLEDYLDTELNRKKVDRQVQNILWCDTLIFVYPTWWYGLPAILKGWLDRVMLPGIAFHMPINDENIKPGLKHINRLGVFTTGGASQIFTQIMGAPGKRTLLRGVRSVCHPFTKTIFISHYKMDNSTQFSRERHLLRVEKKLKKFIT